MHILNVYAVIAVLAYVLCVSNVINASISINGKIIFEQNGRILRDPPRIRANNTVFAKVLVKPSLNIAPNFSYSWMIDDIVFKPSFNSVIECQFHGRRHSTRRHQFLVVIVANTSTDNQNSELGIISRDAKVVDSDDDDDNDNSISSYIPDAGTILAWLAIILLLLVIGLCIVVTVRTCSNCCSNCFEARELKDPLIANKGYYKIYSTP